MRHAPIRLAALTATMLAALSLASAPPLHAADEGPYPCSGTVVIPGAGYCPSAPRSHCMVIAGCQYLPEWATCTGGGLEEFYELTCYWAS